jgi:fluoride exporter
VRLLLVCLGGAVGSGARYLVAVALAHRAAVHLPWATFAVNVAGCFLLQLVLGLAAGGLRISDEVRLLLTTGVMGGFTTYSSFNAETMALWRAGAPRLALAYLLATVLVCQLAGLAGAAVARALVPAVSPAA